MKGKEQLACVMTDFVVLTVNFGLPPKLVHDAFMQIDEYRDAINKSVKAQYGAFAELCG